MSATFHQQFGSHSTTEDVLAGIDLSGKHVLVTGVSAGLGIETMRVLAAHGAQVVGTARDLGKAATATATIGSGAGNVELVEMDLASLASCRAASDKLVDDGRGFDLVIANAGVMACPFGLTVDGFETHLATNHLGHFVFINRIASLLNPGARLVSLASAGHRMADVDLDDPNFERTPYNVIDAYGRSKTANVLFAVAFDRRHESRGVRATAVHPGVIQTELGRHITPEVHAQVVASLPPGATTFTYKTIPQGAATSVWAGVIASADDVGGRYCEDCHVASIDDGPGLDEGVRPYALDSERAEALWAKTEQWVGEKF